MYSNPGLNYKFKNFIIDNLMEHPLDKIIFAINT